MNDFDYDVKQKKSIARGAFAKKGGSRSKKCTLPGDYLSAAEKRKLSTTRVSANLKAPMDWKTFKNLPTEIKREYLEWLIGTYGARQGWVAKDMFGISKEAFRQYVNAHEPTLAGAFPLSGRFKAEQRERWLAFVEGREQVEETPEPETEPKPEPDIIITAPAFSQLEPKPELEPVKETPPKAEPILKPQHITATYTGELFAEDIQAILYRLMKGHSCAAITLDITF